VKERLCGDGGKKKGNRPDILKAVKRQVRVLAGWLL